MRSGNLLFALVTLALLGGAGRLAHIEYSQGAALRNRAQAQQTAAWTIAAQRGDIVDSRGRVLAGSIRRPSICVDPSEVDDPAYAAWSLAPVLKLDAPELERALREQHDKGFMWVKREVSDEELRAFQQIRSARRLTAFLVQQEPRRTYPLGQVAAHVVGFVGGEHRGMAGVELGWESQLAGTDGHRSSVVDVRRQRLREREDDYAPPRDGATVVLTIDAYIQQRVEYHLKNAVDSFKAEWGAAVVMDPRSGEILAMATMPDFDPAQPIPPGIGDKQAEEALEHIRNRAISDSYEPGSVFKPFVAACALDEGLTRLGETFVINGPQHKFGSRTINDTHPYGSLLLEEVISKSSNIGMGLLGARCGNTRLYRYLRNYGFGDITGVGLPGEHSGLVQDFSRWGPFSTQSVPIGQEVAVTPLQIVTAFSVFCNGGVLYRPRIVRGIISASGETIEDCSRPVPVRRVIDPDTAREFRLQALVRTVTSGTGTKAALKQYQVFGKTGTAQIAAPRGHGYISRKYVGSFVGGAPSNEPRAVVVVSLYKPGGAEYYGGTVSAPAAGAILADTLSYMQVPPEPLATPDKPVSLTKRPETGNHD